MQDRKSPIVPSHLLDRIIWESLTTHHRGISVGDELARRYPHDVAPFAATMDTSPEAWNSLHGLMSPGEAVVLFTTKVVNAPGQFQLTQPMVLDQMIGPIHGEPAVGTPIAPLGVTDIDDVMALIHLTNPGPFRPRTLELGRYLGVRVDGRLAAMAGERMHPGGYVEISAVCAHPDFRGRGYPRDLILTLTRDVQARGEMPMLHAANQNEAAISLYRKLGFVTRTSVHLNVVRRAD
ncbi:MAG: GNAT family N-acetyltransferase [Gemmatimonadaceae bacterium]